MKPAWPKSRVDSVRDAMQSPPCFDRDGDREWAWGFGAVYTKMPKRAATCCACGQTIPAGTSSIFVIYTETAQGPWCPQKRYMHLDECRIDSSPNPDRRSSAGVRVRPRERLGDETVRRHSPCFAPSSRCCRAW